MQSFSWNTDYSASEEIRRIIFVVYFKTISEKCLSHKQLEYHTKDFPNSKFHGANMGPIWGRQDPDGPHVGPMNFAVWVIL